MSGLPIGVPMLDIHTAGAGGGSIAWVDAGNALRVGPRSAGAAPGPACYLRGGTEPTVTDANLVLGRLAATSLLGGDMRIDLDAARRSIHDHLARPLSLSVEQAAQGVIRVVNATMTGAIRKLTIARGLDLRDFTLCPFGGAGPLHGADIAVEMGIDQTLVPLAPGVTSAVGLLMSNLREDRVRTHVRLLDEHVFAELESLFRELVDQARQRLRFESQQHSVRCVLGMRYAGQRYELPVTFLNESSDYDQIISDFHAVHERMYGYHRPDEPVELTTAWVSVEVDLQVVRLPRSAARSTEPEPRDHRAVVFGGNSYETPVFDRDSFGAGAALRGPAIVEQLDATTVVLPNQMLRVDEHGQIVLGAVTTRG
jgi:N-methylhydantoinase A